MSKTAVKKMIEEMTSTIENLEQKLFEEDELKITSEFPLVRRCEKCGHRTKTFLFNDYTYCKSCGNEQISPGNRQLWVHRYGLKPYPQPFGPRPWFGLEYELKFFSAGDEKGFLKALWPLRQYMYVKTDGTLYDPIQGEEENPRYERNTWGDVSTYSCEIVTEPLAFPILWEIAHAIVMAAREWGETDPYCGIHIHLDTGELEENRYFMPFLCTKTNNYIRKIAKRNDRQTRDDRHAYCTRPTMPSKNYLVRNEYPRDLYDLPRVQWRDHYCACSLTERTNELRYFAGSTDWKDVKKYLHTAKALHDMGVSYHWEDIKRMSVKELTWALKQFTIDSIDCVRATEEEIKEIVNLVIPDEDDYVKRYEPNYEEEEEEGDERVTLILADDDDDDDDDIYMRHVFSNH